MPVAVALFSYWPSVAVPDAVHVIDSFGASVVCGQVTVGSGTSVTPTFVSVTVPVLVTT